VKRDSKRKSRRNLRETEAISNLGAESAPLKNDTQFRKNQHMNQDSLENPDAVATAAEGAPVTPPASRAPLAAGIPVGNAPALALELGDFLNRIPPGALKEGPHDATLRVAFDLAWLETRIQQRDSTVPLSELYARVPHIFKDAELANSDVPVRLPYLKVTRMLAQHRSAAGHTRPTSQDPAGLAAGESTVKTMVPSGSVAAAAEETQKPFEDPSLNPENLGPFHGPAPEAYGATPGLEIPAEGEDIEEVEEPPSTPEQQVERLQKRLAALEGMQRTTAQELGRERDTRLKVERQMVAAELALREAQRPGEAGAQGGGTTGEGKPGIAGWEWRAVKQLEADIETYRNRIRVLLSERETLQEKNVQLLRQIESPPEPMVTISAPGAGGPAPASPGELQNRIVQLKQERAALEKARQEAMQQLEEARSGVVPQQQQPSAADIEARQQELDSLRSKLEAAGIELAQVKSEREQVKAERDQLLDSKRSEGEGGDRASSISERTVQGLRRSIDAQSKAVSSLTRERDALSEERDALSAELKSLRSSSENEAEESRTRVSTAETKAAELQGIKSADDARIRELNGLFNAERDKANRLEAELASLQKQLSELRQELEESTLRLDSEQRKADSELSTARLATEAAIVATRLENAEKLAELDAQRLQALENKAAAEVRAADVERSKSVAEGRCKDLEADLESLRTENTSLGQRLADALKERDSTIAQINEDHRLLLERTTSHLQDLLAQEQTLHAKDLEAAKEAGQMALDQASRQHTGEISALRSALDTEKADHTQAIEQVRLQLDTRIAEHQRAIETLQTTNAATLELTKAQHQQVIDSLQLAHDEALSALRKAKDDEVDDIEAASKETILRLEAERNQLITERSRQMADIKAAHDEQLALTRAEHEKALAGALAERTSAVAERDQRLANLTADRDRRIAEWVTRYEALQAQHARVVSTLSSERDAAMLQKDQQIAETHAERDRRIAKLVADHRQAAATLAASKDFEIAKIREDLNTARVDGDRLRAALTDAERRYPGEITRLREDLDASRNEASELTARLAAAESDSRRRFDQLTREREALLNEKVTLLALLEETREALRTRTEEFSKQVELLMRQREEARSAADTARASSREQAFALERERNELLRGETEQRERTERELARLRRERDSAVRQRDTLRERADVLLERQQHLLEDLSRPASSSSQASGWEPKGMSGINAPRLSNPDAR
jgi:chromosome segregation ATPase